MAAPALSQRPCPMGPKVSRWRVPLGKTVVPRGAGGSPKGTPVEESLPLRWLKPVRFISDGLFLYPVLGLPHFQIPTEGLSFKNFKFSLALFLFPILPEFQSRNNPFMVQYFVRKEQYSSKSPKPIGHTEGTLVQLCIFVQNNNAA